MKQLSRILTNPGGILSTLFPLIIMAVITAVVYANTLHADFIFDSNKIVTDPAIRLVELTPEKILNAGINTKIRNRPLPNISFALNYYFGKYDVEGYHLVNIIIHFLTGAFLFLFFRKTFLICASDHPAEGRHRPDFQSTAFITACFAAALWLLHPVQSQAVTYIVQRVASMAAMFYVLSLLLYVLGRLSWQSKQNRIKAAAWFTGCLIAGFCAVISKQNAGTLPIIILLYEWIFFQKLTISLSKRQLALLLGGLVVFGAIALLYLNGDKLERALDLYTTHDFTLSERVMTEWRVVVYYISLLLYPHPARLALDHDYPLSRTGLYPPTTLLSLIAIVSLIAVSVYIARKKSRLTAFCILWFFITLIIESSVIGLDIIWEHRLYLAAMMPALLPGILLAERIKPRWAMASFMCLTLAVCSTWTWQRNQTWQTPLTLLQDNLEKAPNDPRVLNNLGMLLTEAGRLDSAITYLKKSIKIQTTAKPQGDLLLPMNNLATALIQKKEYNEAMEVMKGAIQIDPASALSHVTLAMVLEKTGQYDQAIKHYKKALSIDPQSTKALGGLGDIYFNQGNTNKARPYFQKLLAIDPGNLPAHLKLGYCYFIKGAIDKGIDYYEKAVRLSPENEEALVTLGNMYARNHNLPKAVAVYKKAARLNPSNKKPALHLAIAHALQKDYGAAIRVFKQMLDYHPQDPNIYYNIACMYALQDKPAESAEWLENAVEKGYDNWEHIQTDPDLENLRKSKYYNDKYKSQISNNKQITMTKIPNKKPLYDLEERTFQFAKAVRLFVKTLPKTIANSEDIKQLIRASGSVGANYREANESLSKKDFLMRVKHRGPKGQVFQN